VGSFHVTCPPVLTKPWVLGLSSAFHNGSACLLHGEDLVVAIQEERITREKRAPLDLTGDVPSAVHYCLEVGGITLADVDVIADCSIRRDGTPPHDVLRTSPVVAAARAGVEMVSVPHHLGHASSTYATSGFGDATVLVIDGGGAYDVDLTPSERAVAIGLMPGETTYEHVSVYEVSAGRLRPVEKHVSAMPYLADLWGSKVMPRFASLGHMFSSVAMQLFGNYLEAGKVMGLAPFGTAVWPASDFVTFTDGRFTFSDVVADKYDHDDRWPVREEEYQDLSASVQQALEVTLCEFVDHLARLGLPTRLCYAGGVALNGIANHKVLARSHFTDVHILAAAEDSGPAIGAAYLGLQEVSGGPLSSRRMPSDGLGRSYSTAEVDAVIEACGDVVAMECDDVIEATVDALCAGKVVGWFTGGSEFGPRALGYRSILLDPRLSDGRDHLNARVKFREGFRPFAPVILEREMSNWFAGERTHLTDVMLEVVPFLDEETASKVPAVVHVDGTGRVQTIDASINPRFTRLIEAFFRRTGVPIVLNTSFNLAGEPLVETPADALHTLLRSGMDAVAFDDRLVVKREPRP
jgi:carbamoyltransferase